MLKQKLSQSSENPTHKSLSKGVAVAVIRTAVLVALSAFQAYTASAWGPIKPLAVPVQLTPPPKAPMQPPLTPEEVTANSQALIVEATLGDTTKVKLILDIPEIDVNAKNQYGNTALILAARSGHTDIAKLLLDVPGINVNIEGYNGNTALMRTAEWGHADVAKLLLDVPGIDVNAKNYRGETAADIADKYGFKDIVSLLTS